MSIEVSCLLFERFCFFSFCKSMVQGPVDDTGETGYNDPHNLSYFSDSWVCMPLIIFRFTYNYIERSRTLRLFVTNTYWCTNTPSFTLSRSSGNWQTRFYYSLYYIGYVIIELLSYSLYYIGYVITELSKHVWKLKIGNRDHHIKWSIIKHVAAYNAGSKRCNLCLEKKLLLMKEKRFEQTIWIIFEVSTRN